MTLLSTAGQAPCEVDVYMGEQGTALLYVAGRFTLKAADIMFLREQDGVTVSQFDNTGVIVMLHMADFSDTDPHLAANSKSWLLALGDLLSTQARRRLGM